MWGICGLNGSQMMMSCTSKLHKLQLEIGKCFQCMRHKYNKCVQGGRGRGRGTGGRLSHQGRHVQSNCNLCLFFWLMSSIFGFMCEKSHKAQKERETEREGGRGRERERRMRPLSTFLWLSFANKPKPTENCHCGSCFSSSSDCCAICCDSFAHSSSDWPIKLPKSCRNLFSAATVLPTQLFSCRNQLFSQRNKKYCIIVSIKNMVLVKVKKLPAAPIFIKFTNFY